MAVNTNGTTYYYVKNAQGDITALVNKSGTAVVEYTYDAWGNILSITGDYANGLGKRNPLRYRGYVYDVETGYYYLNSRYYDPELCRFISADNQLLIGSDLTGLNLFVYCGNNPINRMDLDGHAWKDVKERFSTSWEKVKTSVNNVKNSIKNYINQSAEKHYSRNSMNNVEDSIDDIMKNYTKVSEVADTYHENTSGRQGSQAKYNDKYLSPNGGHYEVIICNAPGIEPYIVDEFVDPLNMGTYNYASNESFLLIYLAEHFVKDVVPYYLYGNTREDSAGWLKWALD